MDSWVNLDELVAQRAHLQEQYDNAVQGFTNAKAGHRAKWRKIMRDTEQQLKRIDKSIYDFNLANQGVDSKTARDSAIGSAISDSIGHVGDAVSSVYGGKFGKFGVGSAEIARQDRISKGGVTQVGDNLSMNTNKYILIGVGVVILALLMFKKK